MTSATWRCNTCGFTVPVDEIGREIMMEHLREHRAAKQGGTSMSKVQD